MNPTAPLAGRREFLHWVEAGLGGAALALLMGRSAGAAGIPGEAQDPPPHHAPKAKRAIHLCLCGGFSQVDTFDYKPALIRLHGKSLASDQRPDVFFGKVGLLRRPDW